MWLHPIRYWNIAKINACDPGDCLTANGGGMAWHKVDHGRLAVCTLQAAYRRHLHKLDNWLLQGSDPWEATLHFLSARLQALPYAIAWALLQTLWSELALNTEDLMCNSGCLFLYILVNDMKKCFPYILQILLDYQMKRDLLRSSSPLTATMTPAVHRVLVSWTCCPPHPSPPQHRWSPMVSCAVTGIAQEERCVSVGVGTEGEGSGILHQMSSRPRSCSMRGKVSSVA